MECMNDSKTGGRGLGTSTRRLICFSSLFTPPVCLHTENPKTQKMPRGVESQSIRGTSFDTKGNLPDLAQLLNVSVGIQTRDA